MIKLETRLLPCMSTPGFSLRKQKQNKLNTNEHTNIFMGLAKLTLQDKDKKDPEIKQSLHHKKGSGSLYCQKRIFTF